MDSTKFGVRRYKYAVNLAVILLTWFGISISGESRLTGQERLLDWLPNEPAIYIWSDDSQSFLDDLESLYVGVRSDFILSEDIDELLSDSTNPLPSRRRDADGFPNKIEALDAIWDKCRDRELFDGEVVLMVWPAAEPFDDPNDDSRIDDRRRVDSTEVKESAVFLARTSATAPEFEELFKAIGSLGHPTDREFHSESDSSPRINAIGEWQVDDGWFCWSSSSEKVEQWLAIAGNPRHGKPLLRDDRSYRRAMSQLTSRQTDRPSLSIYFSADVLPAIVSIVRPLSIQLSNFDPASWRSQLLSEVRGVGGALYISDRGFEESLDAQIAFDAFAVVTSPRHGILRGLGAEFLDEMTLQYPTMGAPLASFQYFAIDGEELSNGLNEIARNEEHDDSLFQFVRGVSEVEYVGFPENGRSRLDSKWIVRRLSDSEGYRRLFASSFPEYSFTSGSNFASPIFDIGENELWICTQSPDRVELVRDQLKSSQTMLEEAEFEIELEEFKRRSTATLERMKRPIGVTIGDWSFSAVHLDAGLVELASNFDKTHPQLEELNETVGRMRTTFGNSSPLVSLTCHWSDGLWQDALIRSGVARKDVVDWLEPMRQRAEALSESELQWLKFQRQIYDRMHQMVLTVSSDSVGFRINGVLVRLRPRNSEEN